MIEMVVGVAAAGVVSNPLVVFGMNVRSLGMSLGVVEFTVLVLRRRLMCRSLVCRSPRWCGTVRRNVASADAVFSATASRRRSMGRRSMCRRPVGRLSALVLSVKRQSKQQCSNRQSCKIFQAVLQSQSIISLTVRWKRKELSMGNPPN
jgi:hypothetical protein